MLFRQPNVRTKKYWQYLAIRGTSRLFDKPLKVVRHNSILLLVIVTNSPYENEADWNVGYHDINTITFG